MYTNLVAFFGAFIEAKIWMSFIRTYIDLSPPLSILPLSFSLTHLIVFPLSFFRMEFWLVTFQKRDI